VAAGEEGRFFADTYGQAMSKDTISRITDKVIEEMVE
jgi:transposase-like protein